MESQNYKQSLSSQALIESKNEIETLQKCIEDKDNLLTQLSEKVNAISTEYIGLKTSYEMSRQKEEESAKVVKSLMSDAEELRKQASMNGSVNISSPDSDVEVKVQEVRLELEETYGKQITVMKEELSKHYQAQIETLSCELNNVKQVCATLENQQEILQQEKQTLTTCNETYTLVVSELETKLAEVNSRLDEIQNEKEEILKLNETLNKQINVINKQDVQFENENRHHEKQVLLTRKEIVSEEVEKINSITELNEKNLKLSTELENLRTEYVEAKKLIDNLQKKGKGGRSQQFQVDSQEIVMELKQVTEQYEEALVNIAMMQARIEDYDIKCENLNDDLLKLKEKYVKTDEAMKNNEERLKEYEEKQESMVLEKQEMMEKWKNAQRQCEEYRDKFVEYEQQLTDYEGLMIQFNELQHECNVYQTHNDELNNKMNIQQDVVVELKAELEVLTNQNQAYQEQALLQTQQLGEISQENKSLQESVNQHKDELTTLTNSFNLVTAEVDVYREKANSLETMVENLNKELQMKGDAEFESKQKDVLIQELTSKISDLTSALKSDHDHLHKETVLHEECSMQKEVSLHEESLAPLSNEECLSALENQIIATDNVQNQSDEIDSRNIDKSGGMLQPVQIIQLEASVTSSEVPFNLIGHQEINEHQSELQLGAGMEVGRDMDADSLDDNESTRTIDSIEDSSHRRNDLMIRISDLHGQNQSLVSDYKTLSDENLELKMNIQKLNDELVEMSGSKSDFEQIVQTFKSIIDKMEAEKEEMEISWKSTEECNLALSEKLKYEESNLTVVEEEKMALQSELTFMNSIINEISQTEDVSQDDALLGALHVDEGLSQTASTSHVDEGLSQTASTNMCNKLQTVKQNVNTLHQECDQLKVEILEINEIHRNELLQRQEENDNLRKELGWLEHQINDLKADEEKSKESQTTEIKILQTENDNLNQKLVEMGEREQNLRVQVDRLSQQVFELSVINQTVSGDKENLENRFVEVSAKESDALEGEVISLSGDCQVLSSTISHDLFVANQQIFPVAGKDVNDLNEKIDREVSGEMETQTNGEKDTASLDGSVNLKVVTTSLSAGSLETLSTSTADQSTDQSTTVRSTCMPTNLGQVMNVCSSVSVKSVNQLPPNYVHGLVASDAFNGKMVDNHDCQTNDCKQAENLDQKEFEKSLNLSNVTEESSFQSCSETFDQMLQVDSIERSNDNMCSAVQNGVGISEISQTTDDGNPSQYLDQVENENENNERSEHLRNENTILKVKLEDTQNDMSEMLNDRVELVGSMENFSDKINSLRSHNEQLSHDLLRAIDENKLLRKQLIENGENSEIRCKLEDKIIELVTENQKLKAEYAKTQTLFKEEHESLKSAISSWQEGTVSGQQLKEEVTGLFKEIENLSEEKHEMKIALMSMEEAYVSKQSLNEELQRQVLENSKNLKDMEKWKIHAEDLDSRCKETEEKLENEIEKWCVNVKTIECQKKEIIENLEQELEQRKIYLKELQSKTKEVDALNGQCLEVSTEKDKLLGKCKEYECCISELKTKNSELVIDKEETMTQWSDTEKKLRSEIVELTEKCTSQEKLINELHTERCQSVEETRNNQVLFQEKELNFMKVLDELNEKFNNLEKQNQDINDQYTHHRTENEKLQELCVIYETKINELNEKCSTYENQLTDALSNGEKLNQELKENCTKYKKQAKEIMEKCESSENQLSETKETCSSYENQLSEMKEACSTCENQLSEMKESYENQLSETKETYSSYENQLSEMEESCSNYENQNTVLQAKCISCEKQLIELKESYSSCEDTLKDVNEKCTFYEKQLTELQDTHERENKELDGKLKKLNAELIEVKMEHSQLLEMKENRINEMEQTISTLSVKNQELCEKNEQLENTTEDISLKYSELLKSKELLEIKKQEELSYISVKNDELNTNIKSLEKELKDIKVVHSELVETNTKMKNVFENKISTLSTENKELAKKCKHLELKKKAVKTKNSELVQNNNVTQEKLQQTVAELSSENDDLTQKCQVQEQNIQSMESRLVALEQTKNVIEIELNTTKDQLFEENNHLKTNIEDLQTKNHGLIEKLEMDKNHLDQVTSEFECLKVLYSETEKENTSLIVKVKEANEQSEQMQESLQEIMEELEQTQKSVLKLQEDQIELKNKKDMLEKENDHMMQEREKLSQEIEQLSDELCSVEEERNELLKSQDLTEQSLRDMKANYESLIKLLHDTKNECGNEITMLKAQLTQVSEEVHSLKACQDILQSDLSNVTSQKLQVISELEQEQREREQIFLKNSQLQQELKDKCEKDLHNQAIIDAKNEASSLNYRDTLTSSVEIAIQTDLNSNAKQEVINAETQVDFYESNYEIDHCQNRLENDGRNEHFSNEMTGNLACAKAEEDGRTFNVEENVDTDNLTNNVDAISQGSLVEVDNELEENADDSELISEEELEALIQLKIDSEKKQIEYDMEEKYEIRFRQQQVELMHTFDKRHQDLEKNFEKQVNHRLESLRAEKDQAFVKALQKMKKDFEKKHRKEMEKQRLAHQHEMAIMQDERKGGGHISGVVQKLHQENQVCIKYDSSLLRRPPLLQ